MITSEKISQFDGEYRFLSNFYLIDIRQDGMLFPSVEHAYQANKTSLKGERLAFTSHRYTAGDAKRMGRNLTLRANWEEVKNRIMESLVRQKFLNYYLLEKLLATGDKWLEEGNSWHDVYWGVCSGTCKKGPHEPVGSNKLGMLLMKIRAELRGFRMIFES